MRFFLEVATDVSVVFLVIHLYALFGVDRVFGAKIEPVDEEGTIVLATLINAIIFAFLVLTLGIYDASQT